MPDKYGVLDNMFGPVDDDFYGLVGRIALVSAVVDDRLLSLVWALEDEPQHVQSGKPTDALIRLIRRRLTASAEDVQADGCLLVDRAVAALAKRHEIVHSLWPNPTLQAAQGWRPVPARKRISDDPRDAVVWTTTNATILVQSVHDLVTISQELERFTQRIHSEKARVIAYGQGPADAG